MKGNVRSLGAHVGDTNPNQIIASFNIEAVFCTILIVGDVWDCTMSYHAQSEGYVEITFHLNTREISKVLHVEFCHVEPLRSIRTPARIQQDPGCAAGRDLCKTRYPRGPCSYIYFGS